MLSGDALVKALQKGGYVIVMRHASSPREVPEKSVANRDNTKPERQLDQEGRTTATAMGNALRSLKIPVGEVISSPTYRALETLRLAGLPNPKAVPELGDNGQSMSGGTDAQATWLQKQVTMFPSGTDTILVTHLPNLTRAFPKDAMGMADGEALIFAPDGNGGAKVVARIKIEDWPRLKN
jgi:phosphohistidine phosphatase SixA